MHQIHSEEALFSYVKNGKLHGIIVTNTDDLVLAGDSVFDKDIVEELRSTFTFSKIESNKFTYCGIQITVNDDGSIELNQDQFIDSLREISEIDVKEDRKLTEKEKRLVRGKIGELLWISLISRPDLSFEVNHVSSQIADGSVSLVKTINNIIRNAQSVKNVPKFSRLGIYCN